MCVCVIVCVCVCVCVCDAFKPVSACQGPLHEPPDHRGNSFVFHQCAALYDGRVNYWEPAKYVARLRRSIYAAQTDAGRTEGDGVNVNGEPICLVMDVDLTGTPD